ncbi:hypothetical protein HaLaN_25883 [Haematococcus lacustris]|uniref:Uncharacterized protein n=1 Tax=Haematococcus lacustris TaxID=44745 RepID=A0A699ZZB5_HAELA|nr:hypothetical protein HaLaN_25883 [Haematococcus lacustris]
MGFGGSEVNGVIGALRQPVASCDTHRVNLNTSQLTVRACQTNHRTCTAGPAAPVAPAAATAAMPREHMRNHACHLKLPGAAVPALRDVLV